MSIAIIVEGKNDKKRLRRLLDDEIVIVCTFGTLSNEKLAQLQKEVGDRDVYLFTDNDASGKRIRGQLRDAFPDAEQIYTRRGYAGVEGTPEEYMIQQLEKAGLDSFIRYPDESAVPSSDKLQQIDDSRHRKNTKHRGGKHSL